jgi:pyridoxamine 5'-phosphate oxidase
VSRQSSPIADPAELRRRADAKAGELVAARGGAESAEDAVARPPFWGGFRFWFDSVELWAEGADRLHERLRYRRALSPADDDGFDADAWTCEWLQP